MSKVTPMITAGVSGASESLPHIIFVFEFKGLTSGLVLKQHHQNLTIGNFLVVF